MFLSISFIKVEYALRAVCSLTATTVELIPSTGMLNALPVISASLFHVYSFMATHYLQQLFLLMALVHSDVAVIAQIRVIVLAKLGRLVPTVLAIFNLVNKIMRSDNLFLHP